MILLVVAWRVATKPRRTCTRRYKTTPDEFKPEEKSAHYWGKLCGGVPVSFPVGQRFRPSVRTLKRKVSQTYVTSLLRAQCSARRCDAREKASQQARLARHADADPHDDASEHDAGLHDAHGARPCALFLSAHLASGCSIFTWGSHHHPATVHMGCARGAVHGGRRELASWQFSAIFFASPMRQGLAAAWAMLVDVLLLVAAAGSLLASLLVALLHLYLLR
jgi:hypothetical protein